MGTCFSNTEKAVNTTKFFLQIFFGNKLLEMLGFCIELIVSDIELEIIIKKYNI